MAAPPPIQSLNLNLVPGLSHSLWNQPSNFSCNFEPYLGGMFKVLSDDCTSVLQHSDSAVCCRVRKWPIAEMSLMSDFGVEQTARCARIMLRAIDEAAKANSMKFIAARPFADPDVAARKIIEIANDVEAVQDGRIYIERVNAPFLAAGGSADDFRAGSSAPSRSAGYGCTRAAPA
jgi:hypothetical protein